MGRDKALLRWNGVPLAQWIAMVAERAAGKAALVGSPDAYGGLGFRVVSDLYPGEGPLGGILTALADSDADWNLILACDMPELDAGLLQGLIERAQELGADALLPVTEQGPQPLTAVYHRHCAAPMGEAFASGVRAVTAALKGVRCVRLEMESAQFQNVNTPQDWSAYDC